MGILIDFDDEPSSRLHRSKTDSVTSPLSPDLSSKSKLPSLPSKPSSLRSHPSRDGFTTSSSFKKGPPPLLPKPPQYTNFQYSFHSTNSNPLTQTRSQPVFAGNKTTPAVTSPAPTLPTTHNSRASSAEPQGYRSTVRNKVADAYNAIPSRTKLVEAYNALPALRSSIQPPPTDPRPPTTNSLTPSTSSSSITTTAAPTTSSATTRTTNPPYRRPIASYPAAAAQYASERWNGYSYNPSSSSTSFSNDFTITTEDVNGNPTNQNPAINKKEDLWKRRWASAKEIMDSQGVMLRSWRIGDDVVEDAVGLIRKAIKEDKKRRESSM